VLKEVHTERIFFVPGEHDVLNDNGASYLARYGKSLGAKGGGWYSFDQSGVHFVALVNVLNLKAGGLGSLGSEQIEWLWRDLKGLSASSPIVVFAHIPLWTVYPEWAGAPTIPSRRSRCSGASDRSPCSMDTSIRSCRRSKETSHSIPRCRRPFRSQRQEARPRRVQSKSSQSGCAASSASRT